MARLVDRLRAGLVARSPYTTLAAELGAGETVTRNPKAYSMLPLMTFRQLVGWRNHFFVDVSAMGERVSEENRDR